MMKRNTLFTKRRPRVWSARLTQAAQPGRLPTLLAALALALTFVLSAAPAAYAVPAENPPACTVVGWGNNSNGQATPPAGLSDVVALATGAAHSLALKSDGTVVGWGVDGITMPPPDSAVWWRLPKRIITAWPCSATRRLWRQMTATPPTKTPP